MFQVSVSKDYLGFSAGHFVTFSDGRCESIHGHNYRIRTVLEGSLNFAGFVFDFVELKRILKNIVDKLDHVMLIAAENPLLTISIDDRQIEVLYQDGERRWVFPRDECALLPIENTTAELLAEYLLAELVGALPADVQDNLTSAELVVEETLGQSASYRRVYPLSTPIQTGEEVSALD